MPIPKTLKDQLKAKQVVPFVGAGVSMAVLNVDGERLFPSWKQLLEAAATELDADNKPTVATVIRNLLELEEPDCLDAARRAQNALQGRLYPLLREQIDRDRSCTEDSSLSLARLIWQLGSSLVITTNYDRVLEWAAPAGTNCRKLDNHAKAELADLLSPRPTCSTVWHLHGHIDDAANLILTPDGYSRLYPSGTSEGVQVDFEAALQTLKNLIASRSLLFIGYSMDDQALTQQLQSLNEIYAGAGGQHFALISERQREHVQSLNIPIQVVPYESHGQPLLNLLREMVAVVESANKSALAGASTTTVADFDPAHPSFYVPYRPKGRQVLGRETQLRLVREELTSGQLTAIGQAASFQGIGGLGKTQLAVEYAYNFRDDYPNGVVWINADGDIDSQLTALSESAKWVSPQAEHEFKLSIALRRVRSYSDTLLIFDNVEELESIRPYLPEYPANPHVLITSRMPQEGFTSIPLDVLDATTGLRLLVQEANRETASEEELAAAREIVEMLGNLPLAIELAGAFIKRRIVEWIHYRDLLKADLLKALPERFASFTRHEADLSRTLHIGEAVFEEEPLLRDVLDLLTWSGSAPMGRDLLASLLNVTPVHLTAPLGMGVALRLLQKTPGTESYAVHRLVRQVRQIETPLAERTTWVETMARRVGNWFEANRKYVTQLPEFEREIEHLAAWQQQASQFAPQEWCRLLWLQAYPAFHRGQYRESKAVVDRALDLYHRLGMNDERLGSHSGGVSA